jgi:hypothetical protein
MLTCLVPVLLTFYMQGVLKLKKKIIPAPKVRFETKFAISKARNICIIF